MQYHINRLLVVLALMVTATTTSMVSVFLETGSYQLDSTTVLLISVIALAISKVISVLAGLLSCSRTFRRLTDPRAVAEGFWIERVEEESGATTFSVLSIDYNPFSEGYTIDISSFDRDGNDIRSIKASNLDFRSGFKKVVYDFKGTDKSTAGLHVRGYGSLEFKDRHFGRYNFASGSFIDSATGEIRSVTLRRLRPDEIAEVLTEDELVRDPLPRVTNPWGRIKRQPYKNHDFPRIALAFWKHSESQRANLEAVLDEAAV